MTYSEDTMAEFVALLEKHAPHDGPHFTSIPGVITLRETKPFEYEKKVVVYEPAIFVLGKGKKQLSLEGKRFDYSAGRFLCLFLPIPVQVKAVEATPENPLLMLGIKVDLMKFANILLKMDKVQSLPAKSEPINASAIISEPLNQELLDAIIRLLRILDNPVEREVLGDLILDEIYFRLISHDDTGSLQRLLHHRGQVQQIAKAVEHIHQHLDQVVSIDQLAEIVNMSTSGFRKVFKDVMHMPPLQYAKAIKLDKGLHTHAGRQESQRSGLLGRLQ